MTPALLFALLLAAPPAPGPGPVLAVEDTMRTEVPEVLVRAPRVTLDEILDRVARGEARRDSAMRDQVFTATFRLVRNTADAKKAPELFFETVARVYKQKPDRARAVVLREWRLKPEKRSGARAEFTPRAEMDEEIVNFAFRPENRRDYRYRILSRDLLGDHLVYRIGFEPRTPLDPSMPSGTVWVDTRDYVIVRQEIDFERSPMPIFLQGVDRMVVERQQIEGAWVLRRVLLRGRLTIPMPELGRSFDISILFDDYAINRGIDPAVFAGGSRR